MTATFPSGIIVVPNTPSTSARSVPRFRTTISCSVSSSSTRKAMHRFATWRTRMNPPFRSSDVSPNRSTTRTKGRNDSSYATVSTPSTTCISASDTRYTPRMAVIGMRKRSPPALTARPLSIASVRGTRSVIFVPRPFREEMSTVPPRFPIAFPTTSIPTPRPDTWVTSRLVLNPGRKISSCISRSERLWSGEIRPLSKATFRIASRSIPAPSSSTSTIAWVPL